MRSEPLSRYLKISIGIHVAIAVGLVVQGVFFPGRTKPYTPSLRVDLIGLPDQLRNEKPTPPGGAASLPLKNLAPPPPPPSEEAGALPSKKKTAKNPRATEERPSSASERAKLALQRFKALNAVKASSQPGTGTGAPIKGNQVSKGTSLSADARESLESNYRDVLWDHLVENWELPNWLQGRDFSATVRIWIDPSGRIIQTYFQKQSGSREFDDAVTQTLRRSQPLPAPPADFRTTAIQNGILLGFPR